MAIKVLGSNIFDNDPSGNQEGSFNRVNYGLVSSLPSSATEGDIGYANNTLYVFNGEGWVDFYGKSANEVLGGTTLVPGDGYEYHIFTSNDNLVVSGNSNFEIDVLLVGGGGGGGAGRLGGGGGAGGVLQTLKHPISPGTYPVVIGSGGSGMEQWSTPNYVEPPTAEATKGGNTTFDGLTAFGGGAVGNRHVNGTITSPGGSGAGGHHYAPYTGGSGVSGQGNPGGATVLPGTPSPQAYYTAAGGGGAGKPGGNTPNRGFKFNGEGGIGKRYEDYGFNVPPAYGEYAPPTSPSYWSPSYPSAQWSPGKYANDTTSFRGGVYIAGGGGGAGGNMSPGPGQWIFADGGIGGGGDSYATNGSANPVQHATTYGGGGGAGGFHQTTNYAGGNGYQGIAIIRKIVSSGEKINATGGDYIYEKDGIRYHVFLQPGNFVANQDLSVSGLVVGGGGGGGTGHTGGGGGAGGVRQFVTPKSAGSYPVVIGDGGAGGDEAWGSGYSPNPPRGTTWVGSNGDPGNDSTALGYTGTGGGGGGSYSSAAENGGSGGGGSFTGTTNGIGGTGNTPSTTPPQGNPGGTGKQYYGGGGGGAVSAGSTSTPNFYGTTAGPGGSGFDMGSIFPDIIPFAKDINSSVAGGGGGGTGGPTIPVGSAPQPSKAALYVGTADSGGGLGGSSNLASSDESVVSHRNKRMYYERMPPAFPARLTIDSNHPGVPNSVTPNANRFTLMNGSPGLQNTGGGGGGGGGYNGPADYFIRGKGGDGGSGLVILWYSTFNIASTKATGGTIVKALGSVYHVFTSPGTFTTTETITNAEYLVVAGGGNGGTGASPGGNGGGGGAGGVINGTTPFSGTFPVTVGDGAAENQNQNGSNSQLGPGIVATGGGRGASVSRNGIVNTASPGGSGGGGSNTPLPPVSFGTGTPGQGFPGSAGGVHGGAGGGGGAGDKGGYPSGFPYSNNSAQTGFGGTGILHASFPAEAISPAIPAPERNAFYNAVNAGFYGEGGMGGTPGSGGTPGVNYTGGGGYGGWSLPYMSPPGSVGGGGGKGIVIIRYS